MVCKFGQGIKRIGILSLFHNVWDLSWEHSKAWMTSLLGLESSGGSFTHTSGIWMDMTWTLDSASVKNLHMAFPYGLGLLVAWHPQDSVASYMAAWTWVSQETRRKLHHLGWISLEIHVVSFPLYSLDWRSDKLCSVLQGRAYRYHFSIAEMLKNFATI